MPVVVMVVTIVLHSKAPHKRMTSHRNASQKSPEDGREQITGAATTRQERIIVWAVSIMMMMVVMVVMVMMAVSRLEASNADLQSNVILHVKSYSIRLPGDIILESFGRIGTDEVQSCQPHDLVDTPLNADTCASLRDLLRKCASLQAGDSELDDEVIMLNILVTTS
ncbi:hypothetical protein FNV43_RR08655 [Rhamnella rubrinervis]|uniref:Uncharacterized protein n=1 Tax=Rhamnella rubrinervis TaxID=2594499 RepID=A0A8K0H9B3_9ROSA|nr:hypothetical protein FNV43_RR08464 [Rhamnella rubrinervis]KAF3447948.1 hypothetical protein FNV43_RR08655 [Rhamnella rubrinervis]